jgi:hypothetical protein
MLRRIFESERSEVTGDWRKLHTEELILCSSALVIKIMK